MKHARPSGHDSGDIATHSGSYFHALLCKMFHGPTMEHPFPFFKHQFPVLFAILLPKRGRVDLAHAERQKQALEPHTHAVLFGDVPRKRFLDCTKMMIFGTEPTQSKFSCPVGSSQERKTCGHPRTSACKFDLGAVESRTSDYRLPKKPLLWSTVAHTAAHHGNLRWL